MKHILYSLLAIGSFVATHASATPLRSSGAVTETTATVPCGNTATATLFPLLKRGTFSPANRTPKKPNRAMLKFLGYDNSNAVMSPFKREWRLHVNQQHLQSQALRQRKAQRARAQH